MRSTPHTAQPQDRAPTPARRTLLQPVPRFTAGSQGAFYPLFKPALDFCVATALLVLLSPIILVCALLVRLTSRGPAFYSQVRLGRGGRPYWIFKLRTMYHLCEAKSGALWSQSGDPRVTPLGRFLRHTHLDELPQLWNVLRGEMSLIGPRPERPEFVPSLSKAIPLYEARMLVRPGVTGLAQVQLPPDSDLTSVRTKLTYDLYYVEKVGLWMDARIILATIFKVCGVPFGVIRKIFLMPEAAVVERFYQGSQNPQPGEQQPAAQRIYEDSQNLQPAEEPVPQLIPGR